MSGLSVRALLFIPFAAITGCSPGPSTSEVAGGCADAFGAEVCTWVVMEGDVVVEAGADIPLASIEAAPADAPFVWPPATAAAVPFPVETGFTHMTVNWEAMGHPPETFLVPHFDFHFYVIGQDERLAIDCSRLEKPTDIPAGYSVPDENLPPELAEITGVDTLVGVCVPEMGMHALSTVEMQSTEPFDATMIVGYYDLEPIFVEPMIARDFLLQRQSFALDVPSIPGHGGSPSTFRGEYDAENDSYRFSFSGFGAATTTGQ